MKIFKIAKSKIMLDFPVLRQSVGYTCGAASVAAVLNYYGEEVKEGDVTKALKTDEDGTHYRNIIKFFQKENFKIDENVNSIDKITEYLKKDIPVILEIQAWQDGNKSYKKNYKDGHYVVAIGVDSNKVYFYDPSSITHTYIPIDELQDRWHDIEMDKEKTQNLGIAIYGKKPKFDSSKITKME